MDGKFRLISVPSLLAQSNSAKDNSQIVSAPTATVATEHFVETQAACCDAKHFQVNKTDYIVIGLEDGSLHIYNLTKNKEQSYTIPKSFGSTPARSQTSSPYDLFIESNYEHHDAIVSIEIQGSNLLTASKDGNILLWTIEARDDDDDEDMLKFDSELDLKQPLTKAKWLSHNEILVSTTQGELMSVNVK